MKSNLALLYSVLANVATGKAMRLCLHQASIGFSVGPTPYNQPACFAQASNNPSDFDHWKADGAIVGNSCATVINEHTQQGGALWIENQKHQLPEGRQTLLL